MLLGDVVWGGWMIAMVSSDGQVEKCLETVALTVGASVSLYEIDMVNVCRILELSIGRAGLQFKKDIAKTRVQAGCWTIVGDICRRCSCMCVGDYLFVSSC
jgi:hypothetical protein